MRKTVVISGVLGTAVLASAVSSTVFAGGAGAATHTAHTAAAATALLSRQLGPYGTAYGTEYDKYGRPIGTIFQAYCAKATDIAVGLMYAAGSSASRVVTNRPAMSADGRQGWAVTIARPAAQGPPRAVCLVGN